MKQLFFFLLLDLFLVCSIQAANGGNDPRILSKIKREHPRLFFNQNSFKPIKERALDEESELFAEMKSGADALFGQEIVFKDPLASDGTQNTDHLYGTRAAEAAFVYLVSRDGKYLELCKNMLAEIAEYYNLRVEHKLNVHWYAYSRINALAAYDWIYNDLTEKERIEIGTPLLKAISVMAISENRKPFFRENRGDIKTGFYGDPSLAWYAGVVFYQAGIDDHLAEKLLLQGYEDYTGLLAYRSHIAGDDGGAASSVLGYCMGDYPWAEFSFFHTLNSATGLDISSEWPYVMDFVNYVFWNWLPHNKEFGYGDARHITNDLPLGAMHIHLSQMIHFYGNTQPELTSLAKWMQTNTSRQKEGAFPYTRFLLTQTYDGLPPERHAGMLPKARHFEHMGQIFLRSGSGDADTYAMFTAGGILSHHRHYDNNNFVIYKKGFLALDAGTRPQPGLHLSHYYARTVAHNCITIHMPGEVMPKYWDSGPGPDEEAPAAYPNDGGQNNILGAEVIAFDEKADYVYIASDATGSYSEEKTNLVVRQFVFVAPDIFVVFDRVNATDAEYPKTWLLHTANEPMINDGEFHAGQGEGMLFCKTVFPEDARLTKIGGPGKQFWTDGRNYPLPKLKPGDWNYESMRGKLQDTSELFGQWRMEIAPGKAANDDIFLHVIQVGDASMTSMIKSKPIKSGNLAGVKFTYMGKDYEITFHTEGEIGGMISVSENSRKLVDEKFSNQVKPQKGLF